MRKQKYMVIDGKNLVIESITVGKPSKKCINNVAMIIAEAYKNQGFNNG